MQPVSQDAAGAEAGDSDASTSGCSSPTSSSPSPTVAQDENAAPEEDIDMAPVAAVATPTTQPLLPAQVQPVVWNRKTCDPSWTKAEHNRLCRALRLRAATWDDVQSTVSTALVSPTLCH